MLAFGSHIFFFFWPCLKACGVLVLSRQRIEPSPPAVKVWNSTIVPPGKSPASFFFFFLRFLYFYFWLCWVFVAGWAFSSCREWRLLCSCGTWASHCSGFSCGAQALGTGASVLAASRSYHAGSNAVQRLNCSAACGIFPEKGLSPCLLHYQVDSLPLSYQGSPPNNF